MNHRKNNSLHPFHSQTAKQGESKPRHILLPALNHDNYHPHPETKPFLQLNPTNRRNSIPLTSRSRQANENEPLTESNRTSEKKYHPKPFISQLKPFLKTKDSKRPLIATDRLKENQPENDPKLLTLKYQSIEQELVPELGKFKEPLTSVLRLSRDEKKSNKVLFRDRTNSCRVATKKCLLIFLEKPKQGVKRGFLGEEQQNLSTIGRQEGGSETFISGDSYSQLIF